MPTIETAIGTVGELKKALEGLDPSMPLSISVYCVTDEEKDEAVQISPKTYGLYSGAVPLYLETVEVNGNEMLEIQPYDRSLMEVR